MCPPEFYDVRYEINPWMSLKRPANHGQALGQWNHLYESLKAAGAEVELVQPVDGVPDLVFTANAGLVLGERVVLANFRYPERQPEEPLFKKWFETAGYQVDVIPDRLAFEGEGDAFVVGESIIAGYRFRSDIRAHEILGEFAGSGVVSIELTDARFYHLDTCFCPLDSSTALYYPGAFDEYGIKALASVIANLVPVPEADALRFACNAVVLERDVYLQRDCRDTERALREMGFVPHEVDLTEFLKAGGSAKCLTLFLERPAGFLGTART
ncbi:MAG TPA: arginine deiminase family protein [Dehalococcoidia bacterium]|nr:arginine deiminase family protein [Dehalococcoidia bacterium]